MDYEVLICGLGPVGQLLALMLGDRGVKTLAVDQAAQPYDLPRAAVIDDEVLRIFQSVGLAEAVLADAQVQPRASIVTADGRAVEVLRAQTGLLGHPPLVSINQPAMERTMVAALGDRATVELRWSTALEVLDRRADRVDVHLRAGAGGRSDPVSARYVVGCDGASSAVRARLQIPFDGSTAPQRWIVVDALVDRPLAKVPHPHFVGSRELPSVTLPMSPGRHRWEWMLRPGQDAAPFLEPERIRALVEPWLEGEHVDIERAVVYTFHTRMARTWRRGRALLAGDAAHLMPPFAGQGFSSGARDAGNLAWKLEAVLRGAPVTLLDTYERERRAHVAAMQRAANRLGAMVQAVEPWKIRARDRMLKAIDGGPIQKLLMANVKPLPTYSGGAFACRPARLPTRRTVGVLFPQTDSLDARLGDGWAAVTAGREAVHAFAEQGLHAEDAGSDRPWLTRRGLTWALLRPDRFVFATGTTAEVPGACAAMRTLLGASS